MHQSSRPHPISPASTVLLLLLALPTRPTAASPPQATPFTSTPPGPSVPPAPGTSLEHQADLLMAQRQYLTAIHLYEAIPAPPAPLLNKLGIAYEKMRLYDQARLNFSRAIQSDPHFAGPENNLGTVFYVTGDLRRAERAYKHALKLDPRNASIFNNLGTLYFTRRKLHKGQEAYQQALALDPDIFQRNAANSIQTEGTRESRALINFYLAQTCAQAGRNAAALLYLERALDAGFHDMTKLQNDGHFAAMRNTPEFQALLTRADQAQAAPKPSP